MVATLIRTNLGTILSAYVIVFGSFALLAWRIVTKGKRLARHVPPEDRPWT